MNEAVDDVLDEVEGRVRRILARHGQRTMMPLGEWKARDGEWNGRPLKMATRVEHGEGRLRRFQTARVRSDDQSVSTLTMVAVPRADFAAPVLGAELIAFKGRLSFAALDLTPVDGPLPPAYGRRFTEATRAIAQRGRLREQSPPFSGHALLVSPHEEDLEACGRATVVAAQIFGSALAEAKPVPVGPLREAHRDYFRAMAAHMKAVPAFAKLFGGAWVEQYLDEAFFCTRWIDRTEAA